MDIDPKDENKVFNSLNTVYTLINNRDMEKELLSFQVLKQRPGQNLHAYYKVVCKKYLALTSLGATIDNDTVKTLCNLHGVIDKVKAEADVKNGDEFIFQLLAKGILATEGG